MIRPTIQQVAKHAKVSTQTISRVINDSPRVAPQTRERVLAVVKELGYEPNSLARSLVTRRTRTIGVVVYDIANPFYGQLVRGIEDAAFDLGYDLIIGNSDADPAKDLSYLRLFSRRWVDGILATIGNPSENDLGVWTHAPCPVVFLDKFFSSEECSYVTANNREAARHAIVHLLELGHRRISIVTASLTTSGAVHDRFLGYREALTDRGIPVDAALIGTCDQQTEEGGYRAARELLCIAERPTAIFCINDTTAIGALRAIYEAGLEIPRDISVVGFDDIPVASLLRVPLTTVAQPIHNMGAAAVALLKERIECGPQLPHRQIVLHAHLVVRESTAPPRARGEPQDRRIGTREG